MAQEGGCFCANIRYTIEGQPHVQALCHCLDCRKIGGGTYSVNAIYAESGLKVTKGTPKTFSVKADSGNVIDNHFCGDCGSTLWRGGASFPGLVVLKVGTLDDADAINNYKAGAELFTRSRAPWIHAVEGAAQKETK
ncbi:hypothetical protein BU24DRAFT_404011 [Aaosphaeria arxii CBS 175.79]|uniref:CENP-V/GFA domain-containing protein n=1 Tax=Aaosphaeria arxii CBS 175.79 TaxID=1450172 RepID=A0A6A5Y874_9PLEO|nr:uncharacterized protein BU24DRAFT_404011 [Aaosphaeria arxii CBS 175.79]KAF2020951.1 hypothetical protein BU24DRAFT_404011 [Aaosphaeria arxii CBS 175.79]